MDDITEKLKMTEVMKMLDERARRLKERPVEQFEKKSAEEVLSREKAAQNQFMRDYKKKMQQPDEMKRALQYLDEDKIYKNVADEVGDTVKFLPKEETLKSLSEPSMKKAVKMGALKKLGSAGKTAAKKGLGAALGLGGLLIQDDLGAPEDSAEGQFERGNMSPDLMEEMQRRSEETYTNMDLDQKLRERKERAKRLLAGETDE